MTILVLGLKEPQNATWQEIGKLLPQYFTYALSFFWIGTMWVNMHNSFHLVKKVSHRTVWMYLILLFFSSFFPYAVNFTSNHFMSSVAQEFYGIIVLLITLSNFGLYYSVSLDNDDKRLFSGGIWRFTDVVLKFIGLIFGTFYAPSVMIGVLVAAIIFIPPHKFWTDLGKRIYK